MSLTSNNKKYYPFIDGMRCYACLVVIWHHVHVLFGLHFVGLEGVIAFYGFFGVDLFFVISGFLITGLLWDEDKAPNIKEFYWRRFFKIVPVYYVAIILVCAVQGIQSWEVVFSQLFFIQNYTTHHSLLSHTWSLAIEEHFYLLYPWLIVLLCKYVKTFEQRWKYLVFVLMMIIIAENLFRLLSAPSVVVPNAPYPYYFTHFRLDGLAMGCFLALMERKFRISFSTQILMAILFLLAAAYLFVYWKTDKYMYAFATCASAGILMVGYARINVLRGVFENPWVRFIGKHSYSIYLFHYPIILLIKPYEAFFKRELSLKYGVLVICIIVGIVLSMTVERYALYLRDKIRFKNI